MRISDWSSDVCSSDLLRDFPLLDIQPISAQPGSNDGSTANFLTFQMTDAIRRSGWVRVRSSPAAGQRSPRPDPADYQLGGRLYRTGDRKSTRLNSSH